MFTMGSNRRRRQSWEFTPEYKDEAGNPLKATTFETLMGLLAGMRGGEAMRSISTTSTGLKA
jgi:hypothetical protein